MAVASSDKWHKQKANRKLRTNVKQLLHRGEYALLPELRDVSNVYSFNKDGKFYFDPEKYPDLMRK